MHRKRAVLPFIWPLRDRTDPEYREGLLMALRFRADHLRSVLARTDLNPDLRAQNERALAGLERRIRDEAAETSSARREDCELGRTAQ
jgi:hypothetical protein